MVPINRRQLPFIVKHDFVHRLTVVKIYGNFPVVETVVMTFHILRQFED